MAVMTAELDQRASALHGCYDRPPMSPSYSGQYGAVVPHAMSTDCRYTLDNPDDPACAGCRWQRLDSSRKTG